jgi:protein tyrosine phosphatase (PTP) superfamily phosphohydrolase (DUF442 family)
MLAVMLKTLRFLAVVPFACMFLSAQETRNPKEAVLPESRPAATARYARLGDLPGVMGVVKFSDRFYRGAQPQEVKGMLELKKLGITTVLSVEEPDQQELDAAKQVGIDVINVPTEYNGLPSNVIKDLVTKYRAVEGTAYVHCHHGKHRGGTVGAVLRMTFEGISQLEATQEMAELGCSKRYPGLYETVTKYRPNPAIAHRVLKPRPGIDSLIEVTPWLFRGTSALAPEGLAALKDLGITSIISADMGTDAQQRARAAGLKVTLVPVTIDRADPEERQAFARALAEGRNEKVFLHANDDLAKVAAMVAYFRIGTSLWTADEAAREIEALVENGRGARLAGSIRGTP